MLFTVYSGIDYFAIVFKPKKSGLFTNFHQKRIFTVSMINSVICIVVPLVPAIIGLYQYAWAAFAICFELAMLGIENHIAMTDLVLPYKAKVIKLSLQLLSMIAFLVSWKIMGQNHY